MATPRSSSPFGLSMAAAAMMVAVAAAADVTLMGVSGSFAVFPHFYGE